MGLAIRELLFSYFGIDELKDALDSIGKPVSGTKPELVMLIISSWESRNRNVYDLLDFIDEDYLVMICKDFNLSSDGNEETLKRRIKKAGLLEPISRNTSKKENKLSKENSGETKPIGNVNITGNNINIGSNNRIKTEQGKSKGTHYPKWSLIVAIVVGIFVIAGVLLNFYNSTHNKEIISIPLGDNSILDSSNIQILPAPAITPGLVPSNEVFLTYVNNQKFVASPSQKLTLNIKIQFSTGQNPNQITQAFFLPSWSISWPPDKDHYYPLSDEVPSLSPGTEKEYTISFNAPEKEGTYYLWLGMGSYYNIDDAVNSYKSKPHMPAHIKFIVREI